MGPGYVLFLVDVGDQQEVKGQNEHTQVQDLVLPISKGLLTLSAVPKSRWHNLELLDTIRVCEMRIRCAFIRGVLLPPISRSNATSRWSHLSRLKRHLSSSPHYLAWSQSLFLSLRVISL